MENEEEKKEIEEELKKEEEPKLKAEKNSNTTTQNTVLLVLAVILLIIIMLLTVILFMMSSQDGVKTNTNNITEKEENKDISKDNTQNTSSVETEELEITNREIEQLTDFFIRHFPINDITKADIENQELLSFVMEIFWSEEGDIAESFTGEEVEAVIKKYFGNSVKVRHENIICQLDKKPLFIYKDGVYTSNLNEHGHEGRFPFALYTKFISAQKENNLLTLNYKIMYGYPVAYYMASTYYSGYQDKKVVMQLKDDGMGVESPTDQLLEESFKKTVITSFTYEIDSNGTYNLKSITEK